MRRPIRRSVLAVVAVGAVVLVVAAAFGVVKAVDRRDDLRMPSASMEPTLPVGGLIEVDDLDDGARPRVGEIVVFNPPEGAEPGTYLDEASGGVSCAEPDYLERGRPCPLLRGDRTDAKFVQRVVAGPGDTVAFRGGRTIRNGRDAGERFVPRTCDEGSGSCDLPRPITLGPDRYFLAGDNRGEANDSRFWGPIPGDWIVARVTGTDGPDD